MLISDVHAPTFVNRQHSESLWGKGDKFKAVARSGLAKCDAWYLHLDENRSDIVRPGQIATEFEKRHKEHDKSPELQDENTKTRVFSIHIPIQWLTQMMENMVCGENWNKWLTLEWHGIRDSLWYISLTELNLRSLVCPS